jgi:type VI secretion system protein ImpC
MNEELEQNQQETVQEQHSDAVGFSELLAEAFGSTTLDLQSEEDRNDLQAMLNTCASVQKLNEGKIPKSAIRRLEDAQAYLEEKLSAMVSELMHTDKFRKLEGSWRGLHDLVKNTDENTGSLVKMLNISKEDLADDLENSPGIENSQFYKKVYSSEFDTDGGQPYNHIIGDYEFGHTSSDIDMLDQISQVAAGAHCLFIGAASPKMFEIDNFKKMTNLKNFDKYLGTSTHKHWKALRAKENSKYLALALPRVMARDIYGGTDGKQAKSFNFQEFETTEEGKFKELDSEKLCWKNAAYSYGENIALAFSKYKWCTATSGPEGGGKVSDLPAPDMVTANGETITQCPTEVNITGNQNKDLCSNGFLPLIHTKGESHASFYESNSVYKAKDYGPRETQKTENEQISAMIPCVLSGGRIAHYLKSIAKDKIGSFTTKEKTQTWLQNWIHSFVADTADPTVEQMNERPFAEALIEVREIPGQAGAYHADVQLRPWLPMTQLNAAIKMVTKLAKKK